MLRLTSINAALTLLLFSALGASASPRASEAQRELLSHPTHPQRSVELLWLTPNGEGPWPAVLFVHGHQWPERPGGTVYLKRRVLQQMAAHGFLAAAVSQPGYGASDGPPDFCGPVSQQAVRAALAALRANPLVDGDRIALYGGSRGAIVSSMVATVEPQLAALVLRGGIYDLEDAHRRMPDDFGGKQNLEKEAGTSERAFLERSAILAPGEIRAPTLFFHGEADPISPVDHARRLAERIRGNGTPAELVLFRGVEHRIPWDLRRDRLFAFLDRNLARSTE